MGNKASFIQANIIFPKTIKLKYDHIKVFNGLAYIYFVPNKKINEKFIKIDIKRLEKPLETFSIFIRRADMILTKIKNKELVEYTYEISSNRKIIIRTDKKYNILYLVYMIPKSHLSTIV